MYADLSWTIAGICGSSTILAICLCDDVSGGEIKVHGQQTVWLPSNWKTDKLLNGRWLIEPAASCIQSDQQVDFWRVDWLVG